MGFLKANESQDVGVVSNKDGGKLIANVNMDFDKCIQSNIFTFEVTFNGREHFVQVPCNASKNLNGGVASISILKFRNGNIKVSAVSN